MPDHTNRERPAADQALSNATNDDTQTLAHDTANLGQVKGGDLSPGTVDLLGLVADSETPIGRSHYQRFLDTCEADALAHDGLVSVNRVRAALTVNGELQVHPRAFSAMWAHATGRGRPMVRAEGWELCAGSKSGNDGRPYRLRRWVGES